MSESELQIATSSEARPDGSAALAGARVAELEREVARLRAREAAWHEEREHLAGLLEAAEREIAELPALRQELEDGRDAAYWLAVTRASWSWKLGAPLRLAGRVLGRRRSRS